MLPLILALVALSFNVFAQDSTPSCSSSAWTLTKEAKGADFFANWEFFTLDDPTEGTVDYVSRDVAFAEGLAAITSSGKAIMKVDTMQTIDDDVRGRKSVRIESTWRFNAGSLLIADIVHIPTGCGSWPAFWTLGTGPHPSAGEIDVIEGVNNSTIDTVSLHVGKECTMPAEYGASGVMEHDLDCNLYTGDGSGCGETDYSGRPTYGKPFNDLGGGVYAMLWDDLAVSVYFFTRAAIPDDISSAAPSPSAAWGTPIARFPAVSCDLNSALIDHFPIFNTALCGSWAGDADVWAAGSTGTDDGAPSCRAIAGFDTCADYVRQRGQDFSDAFWEINYLRLFSQ